MGLNLTVKQIIAPLRDVRLVILALVANFVLVPILAYLILAVIKLDQGLAIGLILMATAGGAPFLPKLAQAAKGNMAFSVGLMVLLMIVTIIYMPLVLPLLLQGVEVDPWEIARSLIIMMLIPLAIGLFIKARYGSIAESLQPHMSQTSTAAIAMHPCPVRRFGDRISLGRQRFRHPFGAGATHCPSYSLCSRMSPIFPRSKS